MNLTSKLLLRALARAARPYLQAHGLFLTSKPFERTAIVWTPGAERVLVLAPHMDDETIGCGGAIALHVAAGASVRVAFLTDGRRGSRDLGGLDGDARRSRERELVATRKQEARRALETLGVEDVVFFDAEDGRLAEDASVAPSLRQALAEYGPEIVYLPCFLEQHPDHAAVSSALLSATRGSELSFQCFAYEVWSPLFPNCLVRIDDVKDLKETALRHYRSQLADSDYVHAALSLNAYRSIGFRHGHGRFAEAFAAVPLETYRALFEAYSRGIRTTGGAHIANEP